MSNPWIVFFVGFLPPAAAAAFVWVKWLHELREKRKERAAREIAENELRLIRRRGSAPFLSPDPTTFNIFYLPQEKPGEIPIIHAGSDRLLCFARQEVARTLPADSGIAFIFQNRGESADKIRLTMDGEQLELIKEPEIDDAHGLVAFGYKYRPALHGKEQFIAVWFQSRGGFEDTHRYRTVHGFRVLDRVDPQ